MNYLVLIRRRAQEELARLSPEIRLRIYPALFNLGTDPRPPGCKKLKGREGWRIRVGDYRVIYEIDDAARRVIVLRVRHRSEAYR